MRNCIHCDELLQPGTICKPCKAKYQIEYRQRKREKRLELKRLAAIIKLQSQDPNPKPHNPQPKTYECTTCKQPYQKRCEPCHRKNIRMKKRNTLTTREKQERLSLSTQAIITKIATNLKDMKMVPHPTLKKTWVYRPTT